MRGFCVSNNLIVNTSKSKSTTTTKVKRCTYQQKKTKKNLPAIFYIQEPIDWVEDSKYLGVDIAILDVNYEFSNGICRDWKVSTFNLCQFVYD